MMTPRQVKAANNAYVRDERKRTLRLQKALRAYEAAARALGFHPLSQNEIGDRLRQLDMMERRSDDAEWVARQVEISGWQSEGAAS